MKHTIASNEMRKIIRMQNLNGVFRPTQTEPGSEERIEIYARRAELAEAMGGADPVRLDIPGDLSRRN